MDWDLALKFVIAVTPVIVLLIAFDRFDLFNLISLRWIAVLVFLGGAVAGASFLVNWRVMDGFPIGFSSYSRYIAPPIEESLKGALVVLLFALNRIGFKLDAAVTGFAVGAGFSMVENAWFLTIQGDANVGAWLVRGLGTAVMHGGATALFATVAHEMTERQAEGAAHSYRFNPLLFLPGLALATALHSAFNHFAEQPLLAMILTFLLVPMTLLLVFTRGEQSATRWMEADRAAHAQALADIRAGHFAQSPTGRALHTLAHRFARHGRAAEADLMEFIELKTELVLRAEEIMLSADDNGQPGELAAPLTPQPEDRAKFERLQALESKLGKPLLRAIGPKLAFSRNDLWELQRFRARAFGG